MIKHLFLLAALVIAMPAAHAATDPGEKTVRDAVHSLLPMAVIERVNKSELPGFYEAIIDGQIAYVSADGKYILQGSLYNVAHKQDLTAASLAAVRAQAIATLSAANEIRFDVAKPKHTVTVFTDVDCPYCRAFHKNIGQYNALGISVHYVMFPLDIHPGADKKAVDVWCAKDRNAAYTSAMNGKEPVTATCTNPVAATKSLGIRIGINATPTVLTEDGTSVDLGRATSPQGLLAELDRLAAERDKAKVATR
ncbi:MAG: DsbC family protein [Proteobacteria bacterium]|nr:DsbC family protein [Pseudomonadota bacterium]